MVAVVYGAMRQLVLLVGLCLLLPQTAWAKWTRLSTDHFVFVGDASERQLRTVAQRLEQFREVVGRVLGDGTTSSPVPTLVIVFQNDRSFAGYRPVYQGKPVEVGGYFIGGEDANVIAVNASQVTDRYGVIFHEYAHFMLGSAVGGTPVWVSEGLAGLYQTFDTSNGGRTAFIGKPSLQHLLLLRASTQLMPTAQLLAIEHDSPEYNEGDRRGLLYAQSWALVHYLTFGSKERQGQLSKFLKALQRGVEDDEAFTQAFGPDRRQLDAELRSYVGLASFQTLRVEFDERVTAGTMAPSEAIADVEAAGYLGDLLGRITGRTDDARAMLKTTIEANPDAARALAALGTLELRANNVETALPLLERAAALAPGTASVQAAYGRTLTRRATRPDADDEALFAKARTALSRALELEPDNASTIVTLAEVEMASGANPARALSLMQRAVKSSPSREEYRLMLGQAMAMTGDYRGAQSYLALLLARGGSPAIREGARSTMARIATAQNAVRELASAERERLEASPSSATSSPGAGRDEPRRESLQQGAYVPTLRPPQAGESQVLGTFSAVDCRQGAIVLQIDAAAGPMRLAVKTFDEVEFLTYRPDSPTAVPCGPQRPSYRVLATFRVDAAPLPGANTANHAVAIELLPAGYTPGAAR